MPADVLKHQRLLECCGAQCSWLTQMAAMGFRLSSSRSRWCIQIVEHCAQLASNLLERRPLCRLACPASFHEVLPGRVAPAGDWRPQAIAQDAPNDCAVVHGGIWLLACQQLPHADTERKDIHLLSHQVAPAIKQLRGHPGQCATHATRYHCLVLHL